MVLIEVPLLQLFILSLIGIVVLLILMIWIIWNWIKIKNALSVVFSNAWTADAIEEYVERKWALILGDEEFKKHVEKHFPKPKEVK